MTDHLNFEAIFQISNSLFLQDKKNNVSYAYGYVTVYVIQRLLVVNFKSLSFLIAIILQV